MSEGSGSRLLDGGWHSPAVPRVVLGVQLRRLRERCGLSVQEAGRAVGVSGSGIGRLEQGRGGLEPGCVADLLTLFGVVEAAERATVLALAGQASMLGWWQPYQDLLPLWAQTYLGLEQAAMRIRGFEPQFIPGLLQTEGYAQAVVRMGHPHAAAGEIERRVELRMRRQQILHQARPPSLWVVIDEAALRRVVGGLAVMRGQVRHLVEVGDGVPHVTVQVLPFESGERAVASSPVTLLRLPDGGLPDVVYLEQWTGAVFPDSPGDLDYYRHVMNRLATEAAPVAATSTLLRRILSDL